jgi:hypothetical protein
MEGLVGLEEAVDVARLRGRLEFRVKGFQRRQIGLASLRGRLTCGLGAA